MLYFYIFTILQFLGIIMLIYEQYYALTQYTVLPAIFITFVLYNIHTYVCNVNAWLRMFNVSV